MVNRKITAFDLDILGEIGNIGSGNAATALSLLIDQPVNLEVPLVQICNLEDFPGYLGAPDDVRTGIFFGVSEALRGYIVFLLNEHDTSRLSEITAQKYGMESSSVIPEIANIISGAYVSALATMIEDKVDITPPEIGHDMIGSLVDTIISDLCAVADKVVIIGTKLVIGEETFSAFYVLLLEQESLNKLLDYFNSLRL